METGKALRDVGMARVLMPRGCWAAVAEVLFRKRFASGDLVTGEVLRMQLLADGLQQPDHRNAWGALTNALATKGLIEDTGRTKCATDPVSHHRRLPIWRVR